MKRMCTSTRRWLMRGLSLVLVASLIAPSIFILFPPTPVQAAPVPQTLPPQLVVPTQSELSAPREAEKLERALRHLLEAADEASYQAAANAVHAVWETLVQAEQQLQARLDEQEQRLPGAASARQNEMRATLNSRFGELTAQYQSLAAAIANQDWAAVPDLATNVLAALQPPEDAPPAIDLDELPNQAIPKVEPLIVDVPLAVAADTGSYPLESALPAQGGPPTDEDRAPTEDAAIPPEIQELADQLGNDPVAIYSYVKNTIGFDPYFGSRKGSLLTLWERSGNDTDIASLLIALLRASNIPARYVKGRVAIDAERARNWVGNAADLMTAGTILNTGGVTATVTNNGNLIVDHVWVAAYVNETWVPLDASFKQYTYAQPLDFAALTGFDAGQWIDELRATETFIFTDSLQAVTKEPLLPAPDDPENDELDRDFATVKIEEAVSRTLSYIEANPNLTNVDLLGGGYIITETLTALPESFPLTVVEPDQLTEYSVLPESMRAYLTVEIVNSSDEVTLSHRASLPSLANKRITVSYEAATPEDQEVIDQNGGTLLDVPPGSGINLVPVLRINGEEVARGGPDEIAEFQTRRLILTYPSSQAHLDETGQEATLENRVTVGDMFAVGLAYGRTSAEAIAASQVRLAQARDVTPPTAEPDQPQPEPGQQYYLPLVTQEGESEIVAPALAEQDAPLPSQPVAQSAQNEIASHAPLLDEGTQQLDPNDPANLSEPVMGEMLHLTLLAYYNQSDMMSELAARGRQIRIWRDLSVGIASQELVIFRLLGIPVITEGGGLLLDIQRNRHGVVSLQGRQADEQALQRIKGHYSSAMEHQVLEGVGPGAISTMRLHELALKQGIPVYRIDASNREAVLPLLDLSSFVEQEIEDALDQGRIVTVSQQEVEAGDWNGVGWIVQDADTGASAYLISGGLASSQVTLNGGSVFEVFEEIAAYALLAINMGLDVWGIVAGVSLLLVPTPLSIAAGIALIAANVAALGFDIVDLMDLVSGDKSASQYLGEQLNGWIVGIILKRLGISAAARILDRLGPGARDTVFRQLDELTGGMASRFTRRCATGATVPDQNTYCDLLTDDQYLGLMNRLPPAHHNQVHQDIHFVASQYSATVARRLALNQEFDNHELVNALTAIRNAPSAPGLDDAVRQLSRANNAAGAYPLVRARRNLDSDPEITGVAGYELHLPMADVDYQRVIGFDPNGNPRFGDPPAGDRLSGDAIYNRAAGGELWTETKDTPFLESSLRTLNQLLKGDAAVREGKIAAFRLEVSGSVDNRIIEFARQYAPRVEIRANLGESVTNP